MVPPAGQVGIQASRMNFVTRRFASSPKASVNMRRHPTALCFRAAAAHKKSAAACLRMLTDALSAGPKRRVTKFTRDRYVRTWPAGGTMFAYMFSHEAHHRGQIIMLAHQLGYRLPVEAAAGIWWWDKLWKQLGFTSRPR